MCELDRNVVHLQVMEATGSFLVPVATPFHLLLLPRLDSSLVLNVVRRFELLLLRDEGHDVPWRLAGALTELPDWVIVRLAGIYR